MSAKKRVVKNPYRLQPVERPPEPEQEKKHYARIDLNEGDVVDPCHYNDALCCRSRILQPARVLAVKHDDEKPYYTQVLLECEGGARWIGQSWLEWEGKRKA